LDCEQDHTRGYKREVMRCLEEDPQRLRMAPGRSAGRVLRRSRAGSRRVRAPPISPPASASRPTASGTSLPSTVGIDVGREDDGEERLFRSIYLPSDCGGPTLRFPDDAGHEPQGLGRATAPAASLLPPTRPSTARQRKAAARAADLTQASSERHRADQLTAVAVNRPEAAGFRTTP
jgi:hypothetical protein